MAPQTENAQPRKKPPAKRWSRRWGLLVVARVFLASVGLFALVVGVADLASGESLSSRTLGALLLVAGGFMLFAAATADHEHGDAMGLVAGMVGIAVGGLLINASRDDFGLAPTGLRLWWWAIVLTSTFVAITFFLTGWGRHATSFTTRAPAIASLVSLGALVSLGTLLHDAVYQPSVVPASLSVDLKLVEGAETQGGLARLDLDIELRNNTDTRAQVVASAFSLVGSRVREVRPRSDQAFVGRVIDFTNLYGEPRPVSRDYVETEANLLATAFILPEGWYFDPGEAFHTHRVVYVRRGRYDLFRLSSRLQVARSDRLVLANGPPLRTRRLRLWLGPMQGIAPFASVRGDEALVVDRGLRETSLVGRLTHGERFLRLTRWVTEGGSIPDVGAFVDAFVDREGRAQRFGSDAYTESLAKRYGLVGTGTLVERAARDAQPEPAVASDADVAPPRPDGLEGDLRKAASAYYREANPGSVGERLLGPLRESTKYGEAGREQWAMARFTNRRVGGLRLVFRQTGSSPWRVLGDVPGFEACPRGVPRAALDGLLQEGNPSQRMGLRRLRCPVHYETEPAIGLERRVKEGALAAPRASDLTAHVTPADFVRAVYGVQDPITSEKPWRDRLAQEARERLIERGFSGSAVHDQMEWDGPVSRRFRGYVVQLGSDEAASEEVADSVNEIRRADPYVPLHVAPIEGIPGGTEVTIDGVFNDRMPFRLRHLVFANGSLVYGLQLLDVGTRPEHSDDLELSALDAAARPRDDLLALALSLAERGSG